MHNAWPVVKCQQIFKFSECSNLDLIRTIELLFNQFCGLCNYVFFMRFIYWCLASYFLDGQASPGTIQYLQIREFISNFQFVCVRYSPNWSYAPCWFRNSNRKFVLSSFFQSNKPIMEKKRRARINHCLNELKTLILEAMKKDVSVLIILNK